jgi:hypothetical protein
MRLSANPNDPRYRPDLVRRARVFVDGQPVGCCIAADEERGEVLIHVRNDNGRFQRDPQRPDQLLEVVKRGVVKIELR